MRIHQIGSTMLLGFLLSACGGGGGGGSPAPNPGPSSTNNAPNATIMATGQVTANATTPDLLASVGAAVSLSGGASTDPDGDVLTFRWSITQRPASSTLALASETTAVIDVVPDVQGTYVFSLRVTDARGAFADRTATLLVNNSAPTPNVAITATYQATPVTLATRDVSIGSSIVIDASASTDPDGQAVQSTFALVERPAGSNATVSLTGLTARFTADVQGIYRLRTRGHDPMGAYYETIHVFDAQNRAPNAVLIASATPVARNSGSNSLATSVGYTVVLDGTTSADADGGIITRSWELTSRPASSNSQLSQTSGLSTQLPVDVLGTYVVRLTVTDPQGAPAYFTTTINANNNRPTASIATNATPVALPSGPTVRIPVNTALTLRGTGSTDADGDTLTYAWSIELSPPGSTASLGSPTAAVTEFTPDREGNYIARLRVTDPSGAFSERSFNIAVGNYEPAAVLDKSRVTTLVGSAVSASAALSFDDDGDTLTYAWSIDARPVGTVATISNPTNAAISFTPDLPGLYVLTVTVSDGRASVLGHVIVKALSAVASSVSLPFVPLDMLYSRGLDTAVILAANPNTLRIVDPYTGSSRAVTLPAAAKSFKLSPDGRLAAVLHEGSVSLVDVQTATLVRSSATFGSQTDVFLLNSAVAYVIGQTGGQWVDDPVVALDLRTGNRITLPAFPGFAFFYGTQKGVLADRKNRVLFIAYGLSPADISYFDYNPTSNAVLTSGDSPYHGDYPLGVQFFLSGNQDLLFTSAGSYFNTETLRYAGTLGTGSLLHMTHSTTADEALVLQNSYTGSGYPATPVYQSSYRRFSGALFYEDANPIALPTIGGQQSYGLKIFHSSNDDHILLVQTGSDVDLAAGAQYHLIAR